MDLGNNPVSFLLYLNDFPLRTQENLTKGLFTLTAALTIPLRSNPQWITFERVGDRWLGGTWLPSPAPVLTKILHHCPAIAFITWLEWVMFGSGTAHQTSQGVTFFFFCITVCVQFASRADQLQVMKDLLCSVNTSWYIYTLSSSSVSVFSTDWDKIPLGRRLHTFIFGKSQNTLHQGSLFLFDGFSIHLKKFPCPVCFNGAEWMHIHQAMQKSGANLLGICKFTNTSKGL